MVPIDIGLAAAAVPYLIKGVDAFATTVGEKLPEEIVNLYKAIENKLQGDHHAEETLVRAKEEPESEGRKKALEGVLTEKMEKDSDFEKKVIELVEFVKKAQEEKEPQININQQHLTGEIITTTGVVHGSVYSGKINTLANNGEAKEKHE